MLGKTSQNRRSQSLVFRAFRVSSVMKETMGDGSFASPAAAISLQDSPEHAIKEFIHEWYIEATIAEVRIHLGHEAAEI